MQLTLRKWLVGERVAKEDLQGEERATYGKQIVADLSKKLTEHYGAGFDRVSIYNYIRFYRMFPEIVDAVSQQSRDREKIVDAVRQQLLPRVTIPRLESYFVQTPVKTWRYIVY